LLTTPGFECDDVLDFSTKWMDAMDVVSLAAILNELSTLKLTRSDVSLIKKLSIKAKLHGFIEVRAGRTASVLHNYYLSHFSI
jgi:hypothetical protein